MPGVHGLDQGQHFVAADLADHDAVGTEAQRGAYQVGEVDRPRPVERRRSGFEPDGVRVMQGKFGGVLDDDQPL